MNVLDEILPEAGAFYVLDRGYLDFERLYRFTMSAAFFVTRAKTNIRLQRRYSRAVDKSTGVQSDQTAILTAIGSARVYPDTLRRIVYRDAETNKRLSLVQNSFSPISFWTGSERPEHPPPDRLATGSPHSAMFEQLSWLGSRLRASWRPGQDACTVADLVF